MWWMGAGKERRLPRALTLSLRALSRDLSVSRSDGLFHVESAFMVAKISCVIDAMGSA